MRIAVIQRAAVVRANDEKPHGFSIVLLQHFTDGEEVSQRLGHFLVVHPHKTVVQPESRQGLAAGTLTLGDLVFVVRKLQVRPPAMDVEGFSQRLAAHGRAFDMPAGPAFAVVITQRRAVPLGVFGLTFLGRLPQHEVQRVVLAFLHRHALTGAQLVKRLARQLAVTREFAHGIVHVAASTPISQPFFLEDADHGQHLRHIVGRTRLQRRRLDIEGANILVHGRNHLVGQRADGDAALDCPLDDLVVDIGDVAHIGDLVAAELEPALHHIESHHHACMADMAKVVDGHAAHIHADLAGNEGRKIFYCTRQRVVNAKAHGIV